MLENTAAVLLENKHMESLIIAKMARQTQVLSSDIYILYYIYIREVSIKLRLHLNCSKGCIYRDRISKSQIVLKSSHLVSKKSDLM